MNEQYISTAKAKQILGVSEDTLRKWADGGMFPSIRTPRGTRLYNVSKFINNQLSIKEDEREKESYCYCRVSSQNQKDDLQRQIQYMQEHYPNHRIVSDIGSGLNFKRKGLRSLIELATKGGVGEVVVAYRDRLCRFAFELVEWFFQIHQVKVVVLNKEVDSSKEKRNGRRHSCHYQRFQLQSQREKKVQTQRKKERTRSESRQNRLQTSHKR